MEKLFNPRIGGSRSETDFEGLLENLAEVVLEKAGSARSANLAVAR